jgi:alpha-2-macroglobulin
MVAMLKIWNKAALVFAFILLATLPSLAEGFTLSLGADFAGGDYRTVKNTDLGNCQTLCSKDAQCKAFTFNTKAKWCFLKSSSDIAMPFATAVGGSVATSTLTVAKEMAPVPNFMDSSFVTSAHEFANSIKTATPPENKDVVLINQDIQTLTAALNFQASADQLKSLIALGDDSYEAWRNLAYAINALPPTDPNQVTTLNQNSLSAAYSAYERASDANQKGEALALVANGLIRNGSTRPAIDALRLATATNSSPALRIALEDAKLKYGFRVLDYKVNADVTDPQVCVQFSEELKKGRVDYLPFVTVEGAAPAAVTANGVELCVDGVKRGQRAAITIRDGLPSEIGEKTLKPITLSVFIRDRGPTVRFTGTKYVLPSAGRHGVPLVSINAPEIAVDVLHIPARGLAEFVKGSQFLSQLSDYDVSKIGNDSGLKIWSGTLQTDVLNNEEVTTNFPLDDVLKNREPGVYVMSAKPASIGNSGDTNPVTQWLLVSDLGITTLSNENSLSVFVRSLNSAQAVANTDVELIARDNSVLGKAKTNALGLASFDGGLMRGTGGNAPAIVTVANGQNDFGFIDITRGAYDLSDRGVGGRTAPGPIDIFMYPERDIYRPGHTVHLTAIARDDHAIAIAALPLTLIVSRPDGLEYQRYPVSDKGQGGYTLDIPLKSTAMRGMWTVSAYTDPKQASISSTQFRVDDFIPDRIEFDLTSEAKSVSLTGLTEAKVDARFLYGAPGSDLKIEGDITLRATSAITEYPDFHFGLAEKNIASGRTELTELGVTDADGKATISFQPTDVPQTAQPLEATLNVRVVEGSGRAIEQHLTLPAALSSGLIGIKPSSADFADGDVGQFEVIAINTEKSRIESGPLSWQLLKVRDEFQWYQKDGSWQYESTEYTDRVANGKISASLDKPGLIESKLDWGHYRVLVESDDPKGAAASYDFYAGGYVPQVSADTPDILQIALDKDKYKVGDTAIVKITPRFAGTALVNVVGLKLIETKASDITAAGGEISFKVTDDWTPGTYITATLFKPAEGDVKMPGRAIGIMPVVKDEQDRTLTVKLEPPKQILPNGPLTVPVSVLGAKAGDEVDFTLAAVDVGVLNVTGYQPPDAAGWFYGQRSLSMELRDIYGQLINGALGKTGQIRVGGGDEADIAGGKNGNPTSTEVVSLYSGIVKTDANGQAQVKFDVPQFNGTLRLMAVAWSKSAVGNATTDVIVREPVVISEGMPKILAPGDKTRIRFDIENTDGPNGDYKLALVTSSGLSITNSTVNLNLVHGKRVAKSFELNATEAGLQTIDVSLTHGNDLKIMRHLAILVRVGEPATTTRQVVSLAPGQSTDLTAGMLAGKIAGTGAVSVSITRSGALDVPGILQMLDRYPYGCAEQTSSRALPLIYFEEVAAQAGLEGDKAIKERVQDAITRVLANQSSNGSFGLWDSNSSNDLWLDAYVTDFLTRAKEKNYDVPQKAFDLALANLQNVIGYTQNVEEKPSDIAYALYDLARNKKASIGDLRYYAETKLESFPSPLAKAQLGAALAFNGDKARATATLDAAYQSLKKRKEEDWLRLDYGSNLRDAAALLALTVESDPSSPLVAKLTGAVTRFQASARWTSTQENAWMLLAAHALQTAADAPKISIGDKSFEGDYVKTFKTADLAAPVHITNNSNRPIDAVISTGGVPAQPEPQAPNGFTIERGYFNFDGTAADLSKTKQGDRLVVTLKVKQLNVWPSKVMVTDLLPSGLEIDNPSLVSSASAAAFEWLPEATSNAYLEFRDDRFAAAMTREKDDTSEMNFAYVVRAVTPGQFILPPALVEDMYRPFLNAKTESGKLEVK